MHVHFSVKDFKGNPIDPAGWLQTWALSEALADAVKEKIEHALNDLEGGSSRSGGR
ncbi:MAG: hypothetical protein AB2L07_13625 [Thermoanaerobaculaceae bacterium]